jgi:hypothetical protein
MNIKIGNKNKIENSFIGQQHGSNNGKNAKSGKKKSFAKSHPVLVSFVVSLIVGIILLFSFWKDVIKWVENLFK